jgi:large subunit ribosomal protein L15
MDLQHLPKIVESGKKRVGRGIGSGKGGHTTGRGSKGQKARGKVAISFEGTKMKKSLLKRLPLMRGKGQFKSWGEKTAIVSLTDLESWPEKQEITLDSLKKAGLVDENAGRVKILGNGKVKEGLTVKVQISKQAAEKVRKAGGKIESGV